MGAVRGQFIRLIGKKKRAEKIELETIKRVLIPGGRIGDMVCETPFIRSLHNLLPDAKIDVYLDKVTAPLFRECPYVNVIETESRSRFVHKVKVLRILASWYDAMKKRKKYDLCFDFTSGLRFYSILALKITAPKYAISIFKEEKHGIKKDELTIYDRYIDKGSVKHMRDICLKGAELLGGDISDRKYEIFLGNLEKKYENYFFKDKINIIFNYLGGTENKNLTMEEVRESCMRLCAVDKRIVVHIMTLPHKYNELKEEIKGWERIVTAPLTQDILEAAAVIKYADIMVSVDTGVVHIASAFNIPVISIFPDNDNSIEYFSPVSDLSYVIKCSDRRYIRDFDKDEMVRDVREILSKIK